MSWPVSWAEVAFGGGPHVSGLVSLLADYCGLPLVVAESVLSALPHPLAAQIRLEQSTYKRAELLLSQPMTLDLAKALTAWVRAQHACLKRQIRKRVDAARLTRLILFDFGRCLLPCSAGGSPSSSAFGPWARYFPKIDIVLQARPLRAPRQWPERWRSQSTGSTRKASRPRCNTFTP